MKRLWPLGLLLLTAGCGMLIPSGVEGQPEIPGQDNTPEISPEMLKIEGEIERIKYATTGLRSIVERMEKTSEDRLTNIERRLAQVESATARLIQHLDRLSNGETPEPKMPEKKVDNVPPSSSQPKDETPVIDIDAVIAESVQRMKGKMQPGEAEGLAGRLSAIATKAVPRLLGDLRINAGSYTFRRNFRDVVSKLPAAILKAPFEEELRNDRTRGIIVDTIGETEDGPLGSILLPYAQSDDGLFRSQVAEALARTRHREGVVILLSQLRSPDSDLRDIAIFTLKKLNQNDTMGYRPELDPETPTNKDAIARWDRWFAARKSELFQ